MSLISALAVTAAVAAGTAGAVTAYQLAAPEPTSSAAIETTDQGTDAGRPGFAPCRNPARLKNGRCVSNLTRTVVLPGARLAAAPGAPASPRREDDGTFDSSDDARRDLDDDGLAVVADDDLDDDGFGTSTRTRTRTGHATGTSTNTGGNNLGTSTRTRTGHSGTSG